MVNETRRAPKRRARLGGAKSQQLAVYSPQSKMKHPLVLVRQMWLDLLASRELAWQLMIRDISAQYRQSMLGIAWAIVPPLVTALGFVLAKDANVLNIGETDLPYPAYVMFSTSLWQTFAEALTGPVQSITASKGMLARINFPHEALILSKIGQVFFNFSFKLVLIIALFIWFKMPVTLSAILAPVPLLHLVLLGTAVGTLMAPLGALFKDVAQGLILVVGFWMLLTPVVYPVPTEGTLAVLVRLNPVTPLLVTIRELVTVGEVSDPQSFWIASLISIVGLLFAWLIYRLSMPFVVERMSS